MLQFVFVLRFVSILAFLLQFIIMRYGVIVRYIYRFKLHHLCIVATFIFNFFFPLIEKNILSVFIIGCFFCRKCSFRKQWLVQVKCHLRFVMSIGFRFLLINLFFLVTLKEHKLFHKFHELFLDQIELKNCWLIIELQFLTSLWLNRNVFPFQFHDE